MDMPLLTSLIRTSIRVWLFAWLVNSQVCNERIYGTVNPYDCQMALNHIPFAQSPMSSAQSNALRLFSEPQFQSQKFGYVDNAYRPLTIIQLPKIWKQSMSMIVKRPHLVGPYGL